MTNIRETHINFRNEIFMIKCVLTNNAHRYNVSHYKIKLLDDINNIRQYQRVYVLRFIKEALSEYLHGLNVIRK